MKRQADQLHHAMEVHSDRSITRMCAPMFMECMINRPPKTAPFNGPPSCQVITDLKHAMLHTATPRPLSTLQAWLNMGHCVR